jgi:putative phage-type endonuclease
MDSDYVPSSDSDTDSSLDSIKENESIIDELSENDICDITEDIMELIESYIQTEIISFSSPNYYSNIIENITNIIYEDWITFNICDNFEDNEVFIELTEFVEQLVENYLCFSGIPKRERAYSIDLENASDNKYLEKQIAYLQSIPQPTQKSKEWYEFRNGLISASNLWKVFSTESQRNSLIYEKCQPVNISDNMRFSIDSPMHWGIKYEPVTVMIYENMFSSKIGEFGCIQHPKYPFIGASPDGINIDPTCQRYGRMLEIKNIVNREITGIPKEEYWVQTQIQMEVCNLDECDFMETRILEYTNPDAFYEDVEREYRGVILHFIERDMKKGAMPIYKYMPLDIELEKELIDEWIIETREQCRDEGMLLFTTIYWYLQEYSCVLIQRNRQWFSSAVPKIEEIWRIIEKERVEGYEHRAVKKKISVSMNTDTSNSYMIKNMPLQNSICLVKLE